MTRPPQSIDEAMDRNEGVVGTHVGCGGTVKLTHQSVGISMMTLLRCDDCGGRSTDKGFEVKKAGWLEERCRRKE